MIAALLLSIASIAAAQSPAPADSQSKPTQDLAVRGCLHGATLTQIEPHTPSLKLPGVENGVLVGDSDKMKVYVGGGDSSLGEDQDMLRNEQPTMHARTIKDLAPACAVATPKQP